MSPFHTAPGMGALLHVGWLLTAVVPLGAPPDSWKQKRLPHMEQAFPFSIASAVQDFNPVAVGVVDEIEVHRAVFKADAAHFFVQGMRGGLVLHAHGEVNLVVAQVIGLGAVAQPGQLQLKRRGAVGEIDQDEGAVRLRPGRR